MKVCTCAIWVLLGLLVVVIGLAISKDHVSFEVHTGSSSSSDTSEFLRKTPAEFLYLDSTRLANEVAELKGGRPGVVHRIAKQANSQKVDVEVEGVGFGTATQEEEEVESTIEPDASSELWVMFKGLREDNWKPSSFHDVDLRAEKREEVEGDGPAYTVYRPKEVQDGWLVRFETRQLVSPGYIRPYEILRSSATLRGLFQPRFGNPVSRRRMKVQRQRAKVFAKEIGPNPRIDLAVAPEGPNGANNGFKVLMPIEYTHLLDPRNLLETGDSQFTGGRVVVFGKVLRVFGGHGSRPTYTDFATRENWHRPLKRASPYLVDHVSRRCTARWRTGVSHPKGQQRIEGRHCYLTRLKRETQITAPGMVVLPLAIYK